MLFQTIFDQLYPYSNTPTSTASIVVRRSVDNSVNHLIKPRRESRFSRRKASFIRANRARAQNASATSIALLPISVARLLHQSMYNNIQRSRARSAALLCSKRPNKWIFKYTGGCTRSSRSTSRSHIQTLPGEQKYHGRSAFEVRNCAAGCCWSDHRGALCVIIDV